MGKKRIVKIIGYVNNDIISKWYLDECVNKPIIQSLDLYIHIAPHASQFSSVDSFNYTIDHIPDVINAPDYVFYDIDKGGIEYYKKLIENVCVVVQNSKKRELYVASVYPVTETKIKNRKLKEDKMLEDILVEKYRYKQKS